ncbi:hypothetical protein [Agrococcus sp. TSP3-2-1]|uniref:hypothetical protein n=1 Tax=Agrococcus sp. TSP3-2-1 TaxID=2804583 RepID=UPI003CF1760F
MASDFGATRRDAAAARAALDALGDDRSRLAARVTTPRWYHPVVAALATAASVAPGLPAATGDVAWTASVLAVVVILLVAVPLLARRRGIAMPAHPTGRRTRALLAAMVSTLIVLMLGSGAVSALDGSAWLLAGIGALACSATLLLGLAYDRAQRAELAAGEATGGR